ncbi:hypothetical protein [Bradyrhizobium pachyrhizi]|uniref:hypothetical protein n=1 Tax=Bradyrhizobium pachyrhizi TaxID=280333 RepID=UPI000AFA806F|nr:hypothetical protein [Bradyrhizobium pachyrhizi]
MKESSHGLRDRQNSSWKPNARPSFLQCFGVPIRYAALDLGDLMRRKREELRGLGLR